MLIDIKYPWDIVEDVLVKMDKFILPIDFVVIDIEDGNELSLMSGRPLFLPLVKL